MEVISDNKFIRTNERFLNIVYSKTYKVISLFVIDLKIDCQCYELPTKAK